MTEERGRLLHLTRYYQSLDPMDGFAPSNVFEHLLDKGWMGETRFQYVEDKEKWLGNTPSLRDDNATWVANLIDIVTAEAARRRRLSKRSLTQRHGRLVEDTGIDERDRVISELQRLHPLIRSAAGTLYAGGHFGTAILEAYKAIELRIRQITGLDESGRGMMARVFDQSDPVLWLNDLKSRSGRDEQEGFKLIYMGSIQGIRNPLAHEIGFPDDPDLALEHLALASLLMRRLDDARTAG